MQEFNSVIDIVTKLNTEEKCLKHLEQMRWGDTVYCPHCGGEGAYRFSDGIHFKCRTCRKKFTAKVGTPFQGTKVPLQKFFLALYIVTSHKKGISSHQLAKDIQVTQKTAWFILSRLRFGFGLSVKPEVPMGEGGQIVEVDETYVGGKVKNMSRKKRMAMKEGIGEANDNKFAVMGYLERGGKLKLEALPSKREIIPSLMKTVSRDAVVITDSSGVYTHPAKAFAHHAVVEHSKDKYVNGVYHTNGIEGVFSMFDRMVIGIYHWISPKHMQKYCNELTFRYNTRTMNEGQRVNFALSQGNKHITYQQLIRNEA